MDHPDSPLPGNVYQLLLKNVSRDDPLTSEEAQELRDFRSTLTTEQWKSWLQFARDEKHAIRKSRKRSSPPKLKSLAQDPAELLRTLTRIDSGREAAEHDEPSTAPQQSRGLRRHEVSWSDYSSAHHLEGGGSRNEVESPEKKDHVPAAVLEPADEAPESSEILEQIHAQPALIPSSRNYHQNVVRVPEINGILSKDESAGPAQRFVEEQHQRDNDGVSLERNTVIGRNSRPRASSAPRGRSLGESVFSQRNSTAGVRGGSIADFSPRHREMDSRLFEAREPSRSDVQAARWDTDRRSIHTRDATDDVDAAEIARATALRLDSAYSAAQYLLATLAQTPGPDLQMEMHGLPNPAEKQQLSLSILSEMMSSMEKSRAALAQLAEANRSGRQSGLLQLPSEHATFRVHPGDKLSVPAQAMQESFVGSPFVATDASFGARRTADSRQAFNHRPGRDDNVIAYSQQELNSSRLSAWYPTTGDVPSEMASPGAILSAQYAKSKTPGEFSPRNKQLAGASVHDLGHQLDPVVNLQAQLFEASDVPRRSSELSATMRAAAKSPEKLSAQYSYDSAGYVWEGVRHNRAQGPVSRICLAHGPLVKSFDDYPVRVDAESNVVDVVWREARIGEAAHQALRNGSTRGASSPSALATAFAAARRDPGTVLRRERFAFDDIFSGITADGRLAMYCRQRARKALEGAHNLTILSLGCGDLPSSGESAVEPPVRTLLGGGGGTGLISSVIDEIFRFTRPLTSSLHDSGKAFPGSFPTASASPFVASKVAFEQLKSTVTLSAIIISDHGEVFDLLANAGAPQEISTANLKRRKSDGRVVLCNASRLQLQAPADFDRIMGLLLGKRAALQGVLSSLKHQRVAQRAAGFSPQAAEPMHDILAKIDPWAAFNNRTADNALCSNVCASTMLISVSVSGGKVAGGQTSADFHFVSPCGRNWHNPGAEVTILAELVSGLPNVPPPSLLKSSAIGLLLMDPRNPATDFVNVVTVNRENSQQGEDLDGKAESDLVQGALSSLRIIAQLTQ